MLGISPLAVYSSPCGNVVRLWVQLQFWSICHCFNGHMYRWSCICSSSTIGKKMFFHVNKPSRRRSWFLDHRSLTFRAKTLTLLLWKVKEVFQDPSLFWPSMVLWPWKLNLPWLNLDRLVSMLMELWQIKGQGLIVELLICSSLRSHGELERVCRDLRGVWKFCLHLSIDVNPCQSTHAVSHASPGLYCPWGSSNKNTKKTGRNREESLLSFSQLVQSVRQPSLHITNTSPIWIIDHI